MRRTRCFVEGFEQWGLFIGVLLAESGEEKLEELRKSIRFYNHASEQLESFFEIYDFTVENLEKWFKRPIGIISNIGLCSVEISRAPSSMQYAIWFSHAKRTSKDTRCPRCLPGGLRCKCCTEKIQGEVLLLDITADEKNKLFKKMKEVAISDFTEALKFIGLNTDFEIFNERRIRYLESKYSIHILLYKRDTDETRPIREPRKEKYGTKLKLMLKNNLPVSGYGLIENFTIIQSAKLLPKTYFCKELKNCKFSSIHKYDYERHKEICIKYNTKTITCKQVGYGKNTDLILDLVNKKIIPKEALVYRNNFIVTFDLETIEQKFDLAMPERGLITEANLLLLSIAVGCNLPGYSPKCWIRKSSDPEEEKRLIKSFLSELDHIWIEKQKTLPFWIEAGFEKLDFMQYKLKQEKAPWHEYQAIWKYKRVLRKFTQLDVFGFNSGKFDLPTIAGPLLWELQQSSKKVSILKKMASYFTISTDKFIFKDVLKFTAPCSYNKFLAVWGCPGSKSIWPYSFYNNVEEIKNAKKFPPLSAFESKLRGDTKPDMKTYIAAKREFYRRQLLPKFHPDRINSMYGFLRFYNTQDVQPLVHALENCFDAYFKYFGVNAITAMSLPSLAQEAMFRNYDPTSALIYSFAEENRDINNLFRKSVFGGLVNVYRRHICTYDRAEPIPPAARYADNGNPFTSIISLDFTSMYLTCQKQNMPTSPGICWTKDKKTYRRNVMISGHSFKAQQWLCYRQATGNIFIIGLPRDLDFAVPAV